MPDWTVCPAVYAGRSTTGPFSVESISDGVRSSGPVTGAWPTANKAFFVPFRLKRAITAVMMATIIGTSTSGNIDVGIYSAAGTRIVSKGSTAAGTISTLQTFDITDTDIGPGLFYLATAVDNTTCHVFRLSPGTPRAAAMGVLEMASAFPLPAAATMVGITVSCVPYTLLSRMTTV